jgi:chaperonin GroEL
LSYNKAKTAAKLITPKGDKLTKSVLDTMRIISDVVGATLGPGGRPVLIERAEQGLPPIITKDGVTVFRSLGFVDSAAHCLMEAARDTSIRTATEAGDGTTTATVLGEALVRYMHGYHKDNPKVSPQKVMRQILKTFREVIEPIVKEKSIKVNPLEPEGRKLLHSVAKVSANGDVALADAVLECFDVAGDDGNVTILEVGSGDSHYEVEQITGYPIAMGYEESCGRFLTKFINDPATQRCLLEDPVFVVYEGKITDISVVQDLMMKIGEAYNNYVTKTDDGWNWKWNNVVLVATGFSDTVLGHLALNFASPLTINVFPLLVPLSPIHNGQHKFLSDIAAITAAKILDSLNAPIQTAGLEDLGVGVKGFEAGRFRSNIIGHADEALVLAHVEELRAALANPESEVDKILLQERVGKVTGGIAKLKVCGSTNGELKERRDRAEDAVCAVRGAIKHGCLPGGGWTLLYLVNELAKRFSGDPVVEEVLIPTLTTPFDLILTNCGFASEEINEVFHNLLDGIADNTRMVFDALEYKYGDAVEIGVLDSTPGVLEAIRNSFSMASTMGTVAATVVYARDREFERLEAAADADFERNANHNYANERA